MMDAVWTPLAEAVLGPVLGNCFPVQVHERQPTPRRHDGSAFDSGWYGYVDKDLRSLLGQPVAQPYSRGYCGNGNLEACRTSLWAAVQQAAELLAVTQPDPRRWRAPK